MMIPKLYSEATFSIYTLGLFHTAGKKTITNIAHSIGKPYTTIYRSLNDDELQIAFERIKSQKKIKEIFGKRPVTMIFDDTTCSKAYSTAIEGVDTIWDSSQRRSTMGLYFITCSVTDGKKHIPIDCQPYLSKKILGEKAPSKTELALAILCDWKHVINIEKIVADGHYSTKSFMSELCAKNIKFLMKIPSNRVIETDKNKGKLSEVLRLSRNSRKQYQKGIFYGLDLKFFVSKREHAQVYFVSNYFIDPKKIEDAYRIRWQIETFHRTAKQSLGLKECQSTSLNKQHLHFLYVIEAYAYAEIVRYKNDLKNVEAGIALIRSQNQVTSPSKRSFR